MFEPKDPDFRARIRRELLKQEFMKHIGCELTEIDVARVVAEIRLAPMHRQQAGLTHGGVVATIADVASGFAGFTLIAPHQQLVTVELKTSYLYPAMGSILRAVGSVVKHGNTLSFCEADVYAINDGSQPKLCARATATLAMVTI